MQPIGEVTFKAIKEDTEDVAMLGVEVWCSICEEELDKIDDARKQLESNCNELSQNEIAFLSPIIKSLYLIAFQNLVAMYLKTLGRELTVFLWNSNY